MIAAWLLGGALCLATGDDGAKPPGPDRAAYDAAVAAAGRDADAQVDLALWCEARGMAAEKARHLARAVLLDPENPRARGLLGQVKRDGRWLRASDAARGVEESAERKALMVEYFDRRSKTDDDADGQYKLALWCEEKGLKEPMVAHLHRTLQLDPGREGAWRRLGFKKSGKRWVNPEIEAALKAEQEIQAKADRAWKPRLEKLRDALADKDAAKQAEAREALASISDPRAVPALFQVFAKGGAEPRQAVAVDVLSRIDGPGASLALATLAVYSPHAPIRSDASALLQRRDPREFAGFLALQIRDEVKYKVKPVDGPGSQGELLVESKDANIRRIYRPLQSPAVQPGDRVETDANGTVIVTRPVGTPIVGSPLSARALTAMALGLPASSFSAVPRDGLIADPFGVTDLPMVSWERGYTDAMLPWTYMLDRPAAASAALQKAGVPAGLSDTVVGRIQESNSFARSAAAAFGILSFNNAAANQLTIRPVLQDAVQFPLEQMRAQAQTSALVAREHLASDVANIEAYNAPVRDANERAIAVLKAVSGEDLGKDRVKWMDWVVDLQGYGQPLRAPSVPPADVVEEVPIAYQPQTVPVPTTEVTGFRMGPSCFAGGTLVRTLQGDRPIETIRPGDLVLSQDVTTGKLDFKPVVEALHNPPNSTYAVDLGKEVVHPTGIHRFWKAGEGWVMARDLRPGDRLRTAGGAVEVASVAKEEARPVFNLLLAGGDSYHVGSIGLLAHDNGLVEPVAAPFDAVPPDAKLAAATNP